MKKNFERLEKGVVKRSVKREMGVFIDGSSLDRATRRLARRIDLQKLVKGVSAGTTPIVTRYYTLVPYEDDSRQRAFLDAVRRAGMEVVVKRLPPIGITRQVSVEIEMAADIIAFALGISRFDELGLDEEPSDEASSPAPERSRMGFIRPAGRAANSPQNKQEGARREKEEGETFSTPVERIVTVVCPGRDLTYPFRLLGSLGIQTVSADFGQASGKELLKSVAKWIDLSTSETIWRDEESRDQKM